MRFGRFGFAAAALTVSAAAAWGGSGEGGSATGAKPAVRVGTRCRVELKPLKSGWTERVVVYDGTVVNADDRGVGLIVAEERTTVAPRSPLARAPWANRLFRSVGIGRPAPGARKEVWLPADSIRSVREVARPAQGPYTFTSNSE